MCGSLKNNTTSTGEKELETIMDSLKLFSTLNFVHENNILRNRFAIISKHSKPYMEQENNSYTKKIALNTNRSTELYALKKSASCVQFT